MRVAELKALARERRLRDYSQLRKAELIALLRPPPQVQAQSVRFRPDRPRQPELLRQLDERQPSPQKMNIFEQQEMIKVDHKSRANLMVGKIG